MTDEIYNLRGMKVEIFPDEVIELNREVANHPALMKILSEQEHKNDMYIMLCEVAAYCSVVLDGYYTKDDILALCNMLRLELLKKRLRVLN